MTALSTSTNGPEPAGFDYGELDAEGQKWLRGQTGMIRIFLNRATRDLHAAGKMLLDAKQLLGHGRFGRWLAAEFPGSQDTAHRLMRLARAFRQIPQGAEFQPSALYELAAPGVPEEAREEALERAMAGERITADAARRIVRDHREADDPPEEEPGDDTRTTDGGSPVLQAPAGRRSAPNSGGVKPSLPEEPADEAPSQPESADETPAAEAVPPELLGSRTDKGPTPAGNSSAPEGEDRYSAFNQQLREIFAAVEAAKAGVKALGSSDLAYRQRIHSAVEHLNAATKTLRDLRLAPRCPQCAPGTKHPGLRCANCLRRNARRVEAAQAADETSLPADDPPHASDFFPGVGDDEAGAELA